MALVLGSLVLGAAVFQSAAGAQLLGGDEECEGGIELLGDIICPSERASNTNNSDQASPGGLLGDVLDQLEVPVDATVAEELLPDVATLEELIPQDVLDVGWTPEDLANLTPEELGDVLRLENLSLEELQALLDQITALVDQVVDDVAGQLPSDVADVLPTDESEPEPEEGSRVAADESTTSAVAGCTTSAGHGAGHVAPLTDSALFLDVLDTSQLQYIDRVSVPTANGTRHVMRLAIQNIDVEGLQLDLPNPEVARLVRILGGPVGDSILGGTVCLDATRLELTITNLGVGDGPLNTGPVGDLLGVDLGVLPARLTFEVGNDVHQAALATLLGNAPVDLAAEDVEIDLVTLSAVDLLLTDGDIQRAAGGQ